MNACTCTNSKLMFKVNSESFMLTNLKLHGQSLMIILFNFYLQFKIKSKLISYTCICTKPKCTSAKAKNCQIIELQSICTTNVHVYIHMKNI